MLVLGSSVSPRDRKHSFSWVPWCTPRIQFNDLARLRLKIINKGVWGWSLCEGAGFNLKYHHLHPPKKKKPVLERIRSLSIQEKTVLVSKRYTDTFQ